MEYHDIGLALFLHHPHKLPLTQTPRSAGAIAEKMGCWVLGSLGSAFGLFGKPLSLAFEGKLGFGIVTKIPRPSTRRVRAHPRLWGSWRNFPRTRLRHGETEDCILVRSDDRNMT